MEPNVSQFTIYDEITETTRALHSAFFTFCFESMKQRGSSTPARNICVLIDLVVCDFFFAERKLHVLS